jgi:hypothetical protein
MMEDQGQVTKDSIVSVWICWILPIVIYHIFLNRVNFKHCTIEKTNNELSHLFRATLQKVFLDYNLVTELSYKPLGTIIALVDVTLKEV